MCQQALLSIENVIITKIRQQLTAFLINLYIFFTRYLFSHPEANCHPVIQPKLSCKPVHFALALPQEKTAE